MKYAVSLLFAVLMPAMLSAQETFRDWSVLQGEAGCLASISVGLAEPSSGLVTLSLFERDGQDADVPAVMTVRVPVGAALTTPPSYVHPGRFEAVALAWQSCDARSCMASGGVSAAELARIKAGRQILFAFRPLPNSRALIVPVSLMGVTRAWRAVQFCG